MAKQIELFIVQSGVIHKQISKLQLVLIELFTEIAIWLFEMICLHSTETNTKLSSVDY